MPRSVARYVQIPPEIGKIPLHGCVTHMARAMHSTLV